jgi:hypothetical protein
VLVNFEGPYERVPTDPAFVVGFGDWTPPAWVSGYPAGKFAHLVYRSTGPATTTAACVRSAQLRGGAVFVSTDDSEPLWNIAPDAAMLDCPTLHRRP